MPFEFEHPGWPIEDSARVAARDELDRAIGEIAETGFEIHETVRNVRRRLKRVRSIIELIRSAFPSHQRESDLLRNIGGDVSSLGDAAALVDAVDRLLPGTSGETASTLHATRRRFVADAALREAGLDREIFLMGLRTRLRDARVRAEMWELRADDAEAVVPGFVRTYARARKGYRAVEKSPTDDHLHEWRKAVKFHWAQLGLLRRFAPEFAQKRRVAAKALAETLGDHHNLCVMREALTPEEAASLGPLLETALQRLGKRAMKQGRPLFAETRRDVRMRWMATFADRDAVALLGKRR